jgi:hypothetical protein
MGTIPTPPTFAPGETTGVAAKLNQLRDALNFWAAPPQCYAYPSTGQTTVSGVWLVITHNAELFDVVQAGDTQMHDVSASQSRITFRTPGKYEVVGQAAFDGSTTGTRIAQIRLNAAGSSSGGTRLIQSVQSPVSASFSTFVPLPTVIVQAAAGDYIELFMQQTSGANLGVTPGQENTFMRARLVGA